MSRKVFAVFFVGMVLVSLLFRIPKLGLRPMHHDEANQAVKFGALLEEGEYRYDPQDHHGPSLYYLTLPFAWMGGARTLAQVQEGILRAVPLVFGAALLLLLLGVREELSRAGVLWAGLFLAVSPAFVFFSRFYIQEMLFVFFILGTLVSTWRYFCAPHWGWAAAAGLCAGWLYATKETSVIVFAALLGAVLVVGSLRVLAPPDPLSPGRGPTRWSHLAWFLLTALLVVLALYSAFGRHLRGPLDSILSFGTYFQRAGEPGWHAHPWYYYLKMLAFSRYGQGPVWSEGTVLVLALVGGLSAWVKTPGRARDWKRYLTAYTLITMLVFSLISYKTPWNLLPFYLGVVVLAGSGAAHLMSRVRSRGARPLLVLLLAAALFHLGWQSWRSNFRFYADPRNPYVYAHTSTDLLRLVERGPDLAPLHPVGRDLLISVVADP